MRVTIGIPVYNCERWITATIQSALDQSWPDKEVVVVDDGSFDATPRLCREFGSKIRFTAQGRKGGNAARNRIIEAATGEFIQFLDADDALPADKIEAQLESGTRADVLCSPVRFETWSNGQPVQTDLQVLPDPLDWKAEWLRWNLPQTGGCLWRKSALVRIDGWNQRFHCNQEYELYFRAFKAGLRFRRVHAPAAIYRLWSENTVCRKDKAGVIESKTQLISSFLDWLRTQGEETAAYRRLAGIACFEMARSLAVQDLERARRYFQARRSEGLITPEGPAAPWKYRLLLQLLGFSAAERLAKASRS
ncbi:MAG TPA: glycosyltransferase family 2 protein [Chthoniobacterales bacterium]